MDRYFTVMVIPEREKGVRSFRIPRILFHGITFFLAVVAVLVGILSYDYWKILRQVYENKHLTIENRQLKEQLQLFQMKINTLTQDIDRIQTFERKLRIISGLEDEETAAQIPMTGDEPKSSSTNSILSIEELFQKDPSEYMKLKKLYEQKIASNFGLLTGYNYTKDWSRLTQQSFTLADQYAQFDYKYYQIKNFSKKLEVDIHELDQYLLDKESFLSSLPTLLPTKGWITSYYGQRKSPYSGRIKMHEGLDIGARTGTPITAPADGIVTFSGKKPGYGKFVQVDHGYGIETIFAHAHTLVASRGQKVSRGDILARVGSTGYSTGPHVHYEIRVNGNPVDPLYYILD